MSYRDDNYDLEISYQQMKRDRNTIRNCTWSSIGNTEKKYDWCPSNVCSVRMKLEPNGSLKCQECGRTVTKEAQQRDQQKKLKLQHGEGPSKPFLISQNIKTKQRKRVGSVNDTLTEEDLKDLTNAGINVS